MGYEDAKLQEPEKEVKAPKKEVAKTVPKGKK